MANTNTTPRSANYSPAAVLGAIATILIVSGLLAFASSNVKEATANELKNRVVPGNISVVGTAKVRQWQGDGFTLQVPAAWPLITDGIPKGCTESCVPLHRWSGVAGTQQSSTDGQANACVPQGICAELFTYPPPTGNRSGSSDDVRAVWNDSFAQQRLNADPAPRYLDYGGVTAKGGRWVARAQSRIGGNLQTSYLFATCQPGAVGLKAKADRYWELRLTAPADAVPTFQFYDLLASLQTELPSPARHQDCTFAVKS
jgi:hypothetical protein